MKVLVADDDPVCRGLLQSLMVPWGFEVVLAADGEQALQVLRGADPPRLVILDWMMPKVDGFEVCKAVRASGGGGNDTYILLVTGSRNKEDIMKVVVAGADDYLTKPFEPLDLKIRLRMAMRVMHLQDELKSRPPTPRAVARAS